MEDGELEAGELQDGAVSRGTVRNHSGTEHGMTRERSRSPERRRRRDSRSRSRSRSRDRGGVSKRHRSRSRERSGRDRQSDSRERSRRDSRTRRRSRSRERRSLSRDRSSRSRERQRSDSRGEGHRRRDDDSHRRRDRSPPRVSFAVDDNKEEEDDLEFARKIEAELRAKEIEEQRTQELIRMRTQALAAAAGPPVNARLASLRSTDSPVAAAATDSEDSDTGDVATPTAAPDDVVELNMEGSDAANLFAARAASVGTDSAAVDEIDDTDERRDRAFPARTAAVTTEQAAPAPAAAPAAPAAPAVYWKPKKPIDDDDDMFAPPSAMPANVLGLSRPNVAAEVAASATRAPTKENLNLKDNWDDEEGYYKTKVGEVLDGRFRITTYVGSGVFSSVVKALDISDNAGREVAIKVIRSNETMYKAGQKELQILRKLNDADPSDKKHLVRLVATFEHRGHLCLVFESLHMNLRELVRTVGRNVGLNLRAVRVFAQHLFLSLSLLAQCNVLHADIKPDNILINDRKTLIKLCDLGSASFSDECDITPYLVSRFYRAPEIILGLPYDSAIDVWSVACTLFELYTGKILFPGKTNNQMLRLMMEVKGMMPHKQIRKSQFGTRFFDDTFRFISVEDDKTTQKTVVRHLTFTATPTRDLKTMLLGNLSGLAEDEVLSLRRFVDFLDQCLHLNPAKRLTAEQALRHPFIRGK